MKTNLSLILITLFFLSCGKQNADLSLKLEKGKEYKQVTQTNATISQEINGQLLNMGMKMNATMVFHVIDITNDGYEMETRFEKLGMSMSMPQGAIEFSSEKNDKTDIMSTVLAAMKNKIFSLTLSKTGKVIEVRNIDNLWSTTINAFAQLNEIQKEQIQAQIMKAYGGDAIKGSIESVTAIYPENPVNEGDKWNVNTKLEAGMSANMVANYEFSEIKKDFAVIKGKSTIETNDKDAYIETNGMPLKYDLKGSQTSEIKVDVKTGWIIEAKINQEIKGDAFIKENPQMPEGMKIPMVMKSEMLIKN